ncbi:60S ribosomal protein L36a [Hordeum vulgare]|nr:60S ribosomal protein L36a [Hordeum vulgare]
MIETKKVLATERKEDKMARWNENKALKDEKWKTKLAAEERKLKAEESSVALDEERIRNVKKAEEHAIMFMNPDTMDETARKYGSSLMKKPWPLFGILVVVEWVVVMVMVAERMVMVAKRVVVGVMVAESMST